MFAVSIAAVRQFGDLDAIEARYAIARRHSTTVH
jgi:hypothetical protein